MPKNESSNLTGKEILKAVKQGFLPDEWRMCSSNECKHLKTLIDTGKDSLVFKQETLKNPKEMVISKYDEKWYTIHRKEDEGTDRLIKYIMIPLMLPEHTGFLHMSEKREPSVEKSAKKKKPSYMMRRKESSSSEEEEEIRIKPKRGGRKKSSNRGGKGGEGGKGGKGGEGGKGGKGGEGGSKKKSSNKKKVSIKNTKKSMRKYPKYVL